MAAKTSGSRKLKRSDLPKFDHDIYSRISLNNLIVYSVHYLLEQGVEVRMEDIVFACFLLFPQKFALKNYSRWPDSAVISRRWGDCRGKGYIAANTDPGFKLTTKGSRLAEKVAKDLGGSTAKRAVKAPSSRPKKSVVTPAKEAKPVISTEKITESAKTAQVISSQPKAHAATPKRQTKIAPRKKSISPSPSHVNVVMAQPVRKGKVILPAPIGKIQTSRSKVSPATQVKRTNHLPIKETTPLKPVKRAQSNQLAEVQPITTTKNIRPVWSKKTKSSRPVAQPNKVESTQLTLFKVQNQEILHSKRKSHKKASLSAPIVVSKEVKIRAGRFVHLMEKSDAYIHYKKDGKNSKIGEFDFRSLLLCTMESSRETLAKNMQLFKGYASIHNRQDLLTFLDNCEDRFSYLLATPQKQLKKRSREREYHG